MALLVFVGGLALVAAAMVRKNRSGVRDMKVADQAALPSQ